MNAVQRSIAGVLTLAASFLIWAQSYSVNKAAAFHTAGAALLDQQNRPVHLHGINWYGLETVLHVPHGLWSRNYKDLLDIVKADGFNSVRMPFSNEVLESNPVPTALAPVSGVAGLHSMEILDRIMSYASEIGLYVILDNHRSEGGDAAESNGLWYTDRYDRAAWLRDWISIAQRYRDNPMLIGMDLRNEPHNAKLGGACWTGDTGSFRPGCPETDGARNWTVAAQTAGNALLAINSRWLIFVEGVDTYNGDYFWYGGDLDGVRDHPVRLHTPNRLVYSPHEYGPRLYHQAWFNSTTTPEALDMLRTKHWGYIADENIAPLWLSEFGTENTDSSIASDVPGTQGQWFKDLTTYLQGHPHVSWAYWALNGNDMDGLLDKDFHTAPANPAKLERLSSLMKH